jgi:ribosomal protein S18 acetylase RimI-like enzyme
MIEITRHGAEVLDELAPLWVAMVHHHHAVAPELGPVWDDDETWARRRAHYEKSLARDGAFALVARDGDAAVGYAMVTIEPGSPTWREPERWADIDSLSVLPSARGQGVGEALLERVQQEAEAVGVTQLGLMALTANDRALAFYERLGFTPWVVGLRRQQGPGA